LAKKMYNRGYVMETSGRSGLGESRARHTDHNLASSNQRSGNHSDIVRTHSSPVMFIGASILGGIHPRNRSGP